MMKLSSALGGLAGAATLTVLNESVKRLDKNAPPMDLLGMNSVAKVIKGPKNVPITEKLKPATVAGDMISNALYFGMANAKGKSDTLVRGALLGLGAGLSAVLLAKQTGTEENTPTPPLKSKALTVTWYIVGGLIAAAVMNLFENKK